MSLGPTQACDTAQYQRSRALSRRRRGREAYARGSGRLSFVGTRGLGSRSTSALEHGSRVLGLDARTTLVRRGGAAPAGEVARLASDVDWGSARGRHAMRLFSLNPESVPRASDPGPRTLGSDRPGVPRAPRVACAACVRVTTGGLINRIITNRMVSISSIRRAPPPRAASLSASSPSDVCRGRVRGG